jgi:hypothetical protein
MTSPLVNLILKEYSDDYQHLLETPPEQLLHMRDECDAAFCEVQNTLKNTYNAICSLLRDMKEYRKMMHAIREKRGIYHTLATMDSKSFSLTSSFQPPQPIFKSRALSSSYLPSVEQLLSSEIRDILSTNITAKK